MSARTLVVIDVQRDYFDGAHPLPGAAAAGERVAALLAHARAAGDRIVHVRHEGDSGFLVAGTRGAEAQPIASARDGEPVVVKAHPNAFTDTELAAVLGRPAGPLVVVGMMSNMCVDATARAAIDLGHPVTVAHDACAAADLAFEGVSVPAATVHAAFMAALRDAGAEVVAEAEITAA